jgi:putative effector of murein hydrolase LrgA (UPF0299 family)
VVALVIVVYGGYGHHWSWTGINGHTATLWDWLHLLLLPIAVALLPLWMRRNARVDRIGRWVIAALMVTFAALVVIGYTIPWAWTGFAGNSLWDWLNLLALPLAVGLVPLFGELRSSWGRSHWVITLTAATVFVLIVLGGYLESWRWTGFTGNTLWDWLHLLLLPLLLPTLIVPALRPVASARVQIVDESRDEVRPAPDG